MIKNIRIGAVLVKARDLECLATFYRDVLGIPLVPEEHGCHREYGCELGDVHFAIHPIESDQKTGEGGYRVAFDLDNIDELVDKLKKNNVTIIMEPKQLSFGNLAIFRDPEGNVVEIVSPSKAWKDHLENVKNS